MKKYFLLRALIISFFLFSDSLFVHSHQGGIEKGKNLVESEWEGIN